MSLISISHLQPHSLLYVWIYPTHLTGQTPEILYQRHCIRDYVYSSKRAQLSPLDFLPMILTSLNISEFF